jgi:hypothetical protein
MRNTGQYRFDRFRDKHLLSLCLHTLDIENPQMKIDSRMSGNGSAELLGASYSALGHDSKKPSEILEEKISSMRDMLKSYSELSLSLLHPYTFHMYHNIGQR